MDEVHSVIEAHKNVRFILSGSSAKKLKTSHTSLMAGRARQIQIFPLSYIEVYGKDFNLLKFLQFGGLPEVYLSQNPWDLLKDYAGTYLAEEIMASAFVRKIENYSRFLEFAALSSGQVLNFENLASDAMIPGRTIKDYYQLLEETLIGFQLRPFRKKNSRKEISTSKFYFFDTGVLNAFIKRKNIKEKTPEFGELFEHFIFHEIKKYQSINRLDWDLEFWRTHRQQEIDFVLNSGEILIEVKATKKLTNDHIKILRDYKSEFQNCKRRIVVCRVEKKEIIDGIEIYPWDQFIIELWSNKIIY